MLVVGARRCLPRRRADRLRLDRGRLAADAASSTSRSPGFRLRWTGLRIGHLSDFHLGARALARQQRGQARRRWVAERQPDLVCITGDLVSHPRGEPLLRSLLAALDAPLVVLGNHDVAVTRDPFSRAAELRDLERARLLRDEAATVEVRGAEVVVVGVDPETYRRHEAPAARTRRAGGTAAPALPLSRDRAADPAGLLRPDPLGASPRRPDLPPAPGTPDHARASPGAFVAGLYETRAG